MSSIRVPAAADRLSQCRGVPAPRSVSAPSRTIAGRHAPGDGHVGGAGERWVGREHGGARPLDQAEPHLPDQDQGRPAKMADLKELPDHHHLQHGADAAWGHEKGIGHQHELVQAREERPMLEGHADERVDLLLERQVDADSDGADVFRRTGRPLVRRLHQPWAAAGDDVAAQFRQRRRHALGLLVTERSLPRPCRAEDADAIALAPGWLKAGEIVDQIPEPEDGLPDDLFDRVLVTQADRIGPRSGRIRGAHQATR